MVCSLEYVLVCTQVKKEGEGFHLFFLILALQISYLFTLYITVFQ